MTPDALRGLLTSWVAQRCGLAEHEINADLPLIEFGLSSVEAVELAGRLEEALGRTLGATLVWEYPTINALVTGLTRTESAAAAPAAAAEVDATTEVYATTEVDARAEIDAIAVVGLGCRLPGRIDGPEALWAALLDGRDAVGTVPAGRWVTSSANRFGGFLDDVAGFDADFFGITAGEARLMDPQQRLVLEVAWEALQHAAIDPATLSDTATGVYLGASGIEYAQLTASALDKVEGWTATGGALSMIANRLSYLLDAHGPSLTVDTACSSSLVAIHLATRDLRSGATSLAIAGGVNLMLGPAVTIAFDQAGGLAPAGRCRPFDADAEGIVRAEGCGVVVLKRLIDAERDGDRVLALVRGSAMNSDGRSNGLVAPNPKAQEALLRAAYADAGLEPSDVDYVEAHGTGTPLGDPIEASALGAVCGKGRRQDAPLLIGSIKSNLGHLEAAAGVAGFIKAVLALQHNTIPPTLHLTTPNPHIPFADWRLRVVSAAEPFRSGKRPAIAGVSAFGFGGSNAHIVLSAAPTPTPPRPHRLLAVLADRNPDTVRAHAATIATWLERHPDCESTDVAGTLARRGQRGPARLSIVARDRAELLAGLRAPGGKSRYPIVVPASGSRATEPGVWMFSGYGAHWPGMGRHLLATEPAFAAAVDALEPEFLAEVGIGLRAGLDSEVTHSVAHAQPITFGLQVALAALWRSQGLHPGAVLGHSMGEVAAAVVAGALTADDGIRVIARRARLLAELANSSAGPGAMAVVELSEDEFAELAAGLDGLHVAVVAAPRQLVVTGAAAALAAMVSRVEAEGRLARTITTEGAGHSPAVNPLLSRLFEMLSGLRPQEPTVPFYSTVADAAGSRRLDAGYWTANLRRPVRLVDAVRAAADDGFGFFLELSPHPVLLHPVTETLDDHHVTDPLVVGTLRRDDPTAFHRSVATLCAHGLPVPESGRTRILDLPPAPWQHSRHWFDAGPDLIPSMLGATWVQTSAPAPAGAIDEAAHRIVRATQRPAEQLALDVIEAARDISRRLWVVTEGAATVEPGEAGRPDEAFVRGVVRTLALEQPLIRATWLDLDPTDDAETQDRQLRAEVHSGTTDDEIAYRDGRRHAGRLSPVAATAAAPIRPVVRPGAAYIITGGTRGLGLRIAQWLGAAGAGRLILAGRSEPSAQSLNSLQEYDVRFVQGDLADPGVAEALVAAAEPGSLAGVVHAAGVLDDALIGDVDAAHLHRVWAPKVTGARRLHAAIETADLDWWVSFSSAAALLGSPGQVAYAGANAWLDAFARWQRARGVPARSLAWGTWAGIGGATGVRIPGLDPIDPDAGVAALADLLGREPLDAGVLRFDAAAAIAAFPEVARLAFFGRPAQIDADASWAGLERLPSLPADEATRLVGDRIGERIGTVLGTDQAPPRHLPLTELGLDSLAAVRIKNLVEADLGVPLPLAQLVKGGTLADLEAHVAHALGIPAGDSPAGGSPAGGSPAGSSPAASLPAEREPVASNPAIRSASAVIAPRDAAEREAVRLFEVALGRTGLGITDPLHDRQDAQRVADETLRSNGIEISVADLLAAPTPEALADRLRLAEPDVVDGDPVRPLRAGGGRPPLFLAHPAGGSTQVYTQLVRLLDEDQPCYGLERLDDVDSVEERAAHYLKLVREIQPVGPYRLGGWSFGGVLAYEMGLQLHEAGEAVDPIVLIDSGVPIAVAPEVAAELLITRYLGFAAYLRDTYQSDLVLTAEELRALPGDSQFDLVLERLQESGLAAQLPTPVLRHQITSHLDTRALDVYQPRPYAGPVTLYRCTEPTPWNVVDVRYEHPDAARGWDRVCTDLRIMHVTGHHLNLLDAPAVTAIAADLRRLW
jgi:acyl transferase domain-containing protein/thioesterase domain-containing protein/acyl carrier protein